MRSGLRCPLVLLAQLAQRAVADEAAVLFIPQPEGDGFQAGEQRDGLHLLEERIGLVAFLQVVIGNARTEVMDVMETNVSGKPLQHARKFVERTALQGRRRVIPVLTPFPVHASN